MMIKFKREEFLYERDVPAERIGVLSTDTEVVIFMPGDESTPEWQALHPPYEPQEDESLNT